MINAINGTLCYKGIDTIHVETHGIEWEISMPSRLIGTLGSLGSKVRILIWLLHREDTMKLFGFTDELHRITFCELIKANGVGPKQALRILSHVDASMLAAYINEGNAGALEKIPGIGKKTAQNILIALKGAIDFSSATENKGTAQYFDLVRALSDLGYDKKRCEATIKVLTELPEFSEVREEEAEQWLFHKAIIMLSTGV